MSTAQDLIDEAKRIRNKLRYPPNAVIDLGIDLTRKSTAHKGSEPIPDPPVKKVLEDKPPKVFPDIPFPIGFDDILEAVSAHYGVSVEAIKGSSRRAHTCFARFVVVYLSLKLLPSRSLKSIARDLGGRDHSTAVHARDRMLAIVAGNSRVATEVQMIEAYIETAHNNRLAVATQPELYMARQRAAGVPLS